MPQQIQIRRDSAADWTSANPTLAEGEIGIELDTANLKIGDGSTAWTSLAYWSPGLADPELSAIAGLTSAADKLPYFTGSGTAALADFTAAGRELVDDADAAAQRTTLGLAIGVNVQAYDAELAAIASLVSVADKGIQFTGSGTAGTFDLTTAGKNLIDDADAAAQRTTLGLVIGTDVLAHVAPGSSGNLLTSNGSAWTSAAPSFGVGDMVLASTQTNTGAKTFNDTTLKLAGSSSGAITLAAPAAAGSGTVTFPATGTLATLAGSEALTNKTYNGNTLTAGTYTLTGAAGKTLTFNNSLTLAGTDGTTMTFPPASASIGYLNIPQNSQSGNYTTLAADAGKHLLHPSGAGSGDTFTIDSNDNVPFALGTAITFVNLATDDVSIAITSDTLIWAQDGSTGTRALAENGIATALKVGTTTWLISGTGLS